MFRLVLAVVLVSSLATASFGLGPADFERFHGVMTQLKGDRYPFAGSDSEHAHHELCARAPRDLRHACRVASSQGAFDDDSDVLVGLDNILLGALGEDSESAEPSSDTGSDTADEASNKVQDLLGHNVMTSLLNSEANIGPDTHFSHPNSIIEHGLNQAHLNNMMTMLGSSVSANNMELKAQFQRGLQEMDDMQDWDDADPEGRGGGGYLGAGGLNSGHDWNNPQEADQTELAPLLAGGF